MEKQDRAAEWAELDVLVRDIELGVKGFSSAAYAQAKKEAKTSFIFEMPAPDESYDAERSEQACEIAKQEGLSEKFASLAGLVGVFESTNQPLELAQQFFGVDVCDFLRQACPPGNSFTGNASTDFGIKVAHYANAKPIAQTVVMLDLLAMVDIDQPTRIFMEWWDQPVMAMQAGNSRIRDRLIRAMTQE
jgi:hypothetical protein